MGKVILCYICYVMLFCLLCFMLYSIACYVVCYVTLCCYFRMNSIWEQLYIFCLQLRSLVQNVATTQCMVLWTHLIAFFLFWERCKKFTNLGTGCSKKCHSSLLFLSTISNLLTMTFQWQFANFQKQFIRTGNIARCLRTAILLRGGT